MGRDIQGTIRWQGMAAEGKAILTDYLMEISEIPGVAGAHIMAPGHDEAVPEIIAAFRAEAGSAPAGRS